MGVGFKHETRGIYLQGRALALAPVVLLDDTEDDKLCTSAAFKSE